MEFVPDELSFPAEEERILAYWTKVNAFEESVKRSEGRKPYTFYDGPPFATGLPHYGHILAGTIKDIVTRYAHQTGHYVERRFGWDCHGLPIEFEIEQVLGLKTREQVLAYGIENYNRECRAIVMRYSAEWRKVVSRMGRWIDFDNDYKTMNMSYMESVWWVFRQLFDKGLVYRGFKVMPYSVGCTTPLSNFEANMNYKEVSDPAVVVSFPLEDELETSIVAWTTTPWTLPSNLALCVNPDLDYVKVRDESNQHVYLLAEARLAELFNPKKDKYTILYKCKGKDLVGRRYVPLFSYFVKSFPAAFRIISDPYVTSDSGTGVVHCAPAFGEDDYRVCLANGITTKEHIPCPIDESGYFTNEVTDFEKMFIKDADKPILKMLKDNGRLVTSGSIVHSYPFCWRSEKPLIYRTIPSWFVAVENIKDRLLANNEQTCWVPSFVKEKRFHNWLQDARDWAVSRNRYWGTPIPLWVSADFEEVVCIGSVEELERLSGQKIEDLHREYVDKITIPSTRGKGALRRVDEVFDCWFESGAMPYAHRHYPFENREEFEAAFPGDFIAEGLDQTRGWFYTLMVLSTALFDRPAFKNLIVNGLVLAEDGKKMSKRLKNYPDPTHVVQTYGADALRLYLINSPVVRAEPLRFKEQGVKEVVRDVFLPWFNAYRFLVQNVLRAQSLSFVPDGNVHPDNIMDTWIMASTQSLLKFIHEEMSAYRLYTVVPRLLQFLNDLTNWYVRMNRPRIKGGDYYALNTLFQVLLVTAQMMAPFTPFLCETMYQNLKKALPAFKQEDSVHYTLLPQPDSTFFNDDVELAVSRMIKVIELGRLVRDKHKKSLKMPLRECVVIQKDDRYRRHIQQLAEYIETELNVVSVSVRENESDYVNYSVAPDPKALGRKLGPKLGAVSKQMASMTAAEIAQFLDSGCGTFQGETIARAEAVVTRTLKADQSYYQAETDGQVVVLLDLREDDSLLRMKTAREVISKIQQLRKKSSLNVMDEIDVFVEVVSDDERGLLRASLKEHLELIRASVRSCVAPVWMMNRQLASEIAREDSEIDRDVILRVVLMRAAAFVSDKYVSSLAAEEASSLRLAVATRDFDNLKRALERDGHVSLCLDGKTHVLKYRQDIYSSVGDSVSAEELSL